jgi:hypothetical protein
VEFTLFGKTETMTLWEFGVRAGLYREGNVTEQAEFNTALRKGPDDRMGEFWLRIAPGARPFMSRARVTAMK